MSPVLCSRRVVASIALAVCMLAVVPARAQTSAFTYQGVLQDSGVPANGTYDLRFTVWTSVILGTTLTPPINLSDVPVVDGHFAVELDFGTGPFTTGLDRYLQIQIIDNGGATVTTLAPRQRISSTPYTLRALSAGNADTADVATTATSIGPEALVNFPGEVDFVADRISFGSSEYFEDTGSFTITANGDIVPFFNGDDLGSSLVPWDDVFISGAVVQASPAPGTKNVATVASGLDAILALRPVSYDNAPHRGPGRTMGFVAQELRLVLPDAVHTHSVERSEDPEKGTETVAAEELGVEVTALIPVLVRAVQEQQDEIDRLEARLREFEARVLAAELKR